MLNEETILILDFGSQYTQLIARRVREQKVYCEILPFNKSIQEIRSKNPMGLILSGGPSSVYAEKAPIPDPEIFRLGIPVLGICYGLQLIGFMLGGRSIQQHGVNSVMLNFASMTLKIFLPDSPGQSMSG